MKVSESKSNVVYVNGEVEQRMWKFGKGLLEETDKYKYI